MVPDKPQKVKIFHFGSVLVHRAKDLLLKIKPKNDQSTFDYSKRAQRKEKMHRPHALSSSFVGRKNFLNPGSVINDLGYAILSYKQ